MSGGQLLQDTANTIVDILSRGDSKRILRPDDKVVIVGDYDPEKGLSPGYSEAIADEMRRRGTSNVIVHLFSHRNGEPLTEISGTLTSDVANAQFVIGTYGDPGAEIHLKEEKLIKSAYLGPALNNPALKCYVVAARPVVSVLEFLADTDAIHHARELSLKIKNYLEQHRGQMMRVLTPGSELEMMIPKSYPIIADCFEVNSHILNIPSGETFCAVPLRYVNGTINLTTDNGGSFWYLREPVQGSIKLRFRRGRISIEGFEDVDEDIVAKMQADFDTADDAGVLANPFLAEKAFGVIESAGKIPRADLLYNQTILEKLFGWHWAYGSQRHVGGRRDAPTHKDQFMTYGDIFVGQDHLLIDGRPNVEFFLDYAA
ncbi:hypothetical protein JW868_00635 [Candidatus Woesearchaeota archaeon]|nr:hypothetical protein [Candidatus Woesearchaeota archaeon]